jgi:hypothetical protein
MDTMALAEARHILCISMLGGPFATAISMCDPRTSEPNALNMSAIPQIGIPKIDFSTDRQDSAFLDCSKALIGPRPSAHSNWDAHQIAMHL